MGCLVLVEAVELEPASVDGVGGLVDGPAGTTGERDHETTTLHKQKGGRQFVARAQHSEWNVRSELAEKVSH